MTDDTTADEFVEFCRKLMKDVGWLDKIRVAWRERTLKLTNGELTIIAYAVGKPVEQIKHEFPNAVKKLSSMTNRELANLAATLSAEALSLEQGKEGDGKAN